MRWDGVSGAHYTFLHQPHGDHKLGAEIILGGSWATNDQLQICKCVNKSRNMMRINAKQPSDKRYQLRKVFALVTKYDVLIFQTFLPILRSAKISFYTTLPQGASNKINSDAFCFVGDVYSSKLARCGQMPVKRKLENNWLTKCDQGNKKAVTSEL